MRNFYCDGLNIDKNTAKYALNYESHIYFDRVDMFYKVHTLL